MENSLAKTQKKRAWGAEQRLEFIEFRLYWAGGVNRSDITKQFAVSVPQASNDLADYKELAPENLEYDSTNKRYVPTPAFRPRILKPNPDRYLAQAKAIDDGILALRETWFAAMPAASVLPVPSRRTNAVVLRGLLGAIRSSAKVQISYQSTRPESPEPHWRWISPHAFGFDGFRWHVRAFCHQEERFRDFILGRCLALGDVAPSSVNTTEDWRWREIFNVEFVPNPELTHGQRKAIALDFEMKDGKLVVPVRYALLYYFNKRMRLDVTQFDKPRERPIVVANRTDFQEAVARADDRPESPAASGYL